MGAATGWARENNCVVKTLGAAFDPMGDAERALEQSGAGQPVAAGEGLEGGDITSRSQVGFDCRDGRSGGPR